MSAMKAIRAREMAPLGEFLKAEVKRRGWNFQQLAEHTFGRNAKGGIKNGSYIYGVLSGVNIPKLDTLALIARALEVPTETLTALMPGGSGPGSPVVQTPAPVPVHRPDQFSLTINGEGRATLRLHLVDLSADKALRVMASLTSAGLLPTGTETSPE